MDASGRMPVTQDLVLGDALALLHWPLVVLHHPEEGPLYVVFDHSSLEKY
jgi:hypothetical protein